MRYIQTERRIKLNYPTRSNKVRSKKKMWILISVLVAALLIASGIVGVILYKKGNTESVEDKVNTDDEIRIENQAIDQNKTPDEIKAENQKQQNNQEPQKNKESEEEPQKSEEGEEEPQKSEEGEEEPTQETEDSSENYSLWTENHQRMDIKIFTEKVKMMVEYLKTIEKDKCIADLEMTSDMYDIFDFNHTDDQLVSVKCKKELIKSTNKKFTTLIFEFMKYNMLKYIVGDRFAEYFTGKYKDTESYHSFFNDNRNFNLEMDGNNVDVDYLELINIISTLWDKNNNMNSVNDVIKNNKNKNSPILAMNVNAEMKKVMQNKKQGKKAEEENENKSDEEESEETKLNKEKEIERRRSERLRINAEKARKQQEAKNRKKSLRSQKKGNKGK